MWSIIHWPTSARLRHASSTRPCRRNRKTWTICLKRSAGKDRLTPAILDKEQRIKQLREEIASLTVNIRNTELKALNRK